MPDVFRIFIRNTIFARYNMCGSGSIMPTLAWLSYFPLNTSMSHRHRRSSNKRFFENKHFRQNDTSNEWMNTTSHAPTAPAAHSPITQAPPLSENPFIKREVERLFDASDIRNTVASQERRLGRLETIHHEQQEFIADARPALRVMHDNQLKLADKIEEMVLAQNRSWDELTSVRLQCQKLCDMNYEAAKVIDELSAQLKDCKHYQSKAAPSNENQSGELQELHSVPLESKTSVDLAKVAKSSTGCQSADTNHPSAVLAARIAHANLTPRMTAQKSAGF